MFGKVLLLCALAPLAAAGRAPNADVLEDFKKTPLGSRYSNDIYEDASLDVPSLISKYGYPAESHTVRTSDRYVLTAHRIPHGRDRNAQPAGLPAGPPARRPVVLLMHGLLSSSADYVVLGPGRALAYLLAEEGYDVWMGNARGNFYSRKHERLNPDRSTDFWKFSWEEIGLYDLPALVDYILEVTGESQLHYVGHSQGGTTFLVLNSLRPEYNAKFKSFQGLAPASYFNNNEHALFNSLARFEKIIETVALTLGIGEILSKEQAQRLVTGNLCNGESVFEPTCVAAIQGGSVAFGGFNSSMVPLFLSHAPAGSSVRQVAHYGQVIRRKTFARFYFNRVTNLARYGRLNPPQFDVSRITVPSYLYYGMADSEVDYRDLLTLAERLGNTIQANRVQREEFNHFDFIWGDNAKTEVYDLVIENMKRLD